MGTVEISAAELESLVCDAVQREGRAVTMSDIVRALPRALRPASKVLSASIATLVDQRRLFRVGRRVAARPDRTLHEKVLGAVAADGLTAAEIAKRIGVPATRVRKVIAELVDAGELQVWPKQQRVVRCSVRPPSASDLLRAEVARLFDSARKLGIDEAAARAALREILDGDLVSSIREMAGADGALVYLPHLRTALVATYRDKASFDRAVLALLSRGTVQLQSHPTPSLLGAAEREAMIEDGRGGFFSAIGLR